MWQVKIPAVVRETVLDALADASVSLVNQPFLGFPSLLPFPLITQEAEKLNIINVLQTVPLGQSKCIAARPYHSTLYLGYFPLCLLLLQPEATAHGSRQLTPTTALNRVTEQVW